MKVLETEIMPFIKQAFFLDIREDTFLSSPFHGQSSYHKHPELQLTLILQGRGKRIIGSKVSDFESGDMVFLGSNVPHTWLNDPMQHQRISNMNSKVITLFVNPSIFHQMANLFPDMAKIQTMLSLSSKGIRIIGSTRDHIKDMLLRMQILTGFEKVLCLLEIIHCISISEETELLLVEKQEKPKTVQYSDRLVSVLKHVEDNLQDQITLEEISKLACMTNHSFCRFFKNRTGKTFFRYLVEVRIEHACKLLHSDDRTISEVASLSGYNSDSYFCKVFREHTGQSPYQYKRKIQETDSYLFVARHD